MFARKSLKCQGSKSKSSPKNKVTKSQIYCGPDCVTKFYLFACELKTLSLIVQIKYVLFVDRSLVEFE